MGPRQSRPTADRWPMSGVVDLVALVVFCGSGSLSGEKSL